MVHKQVCSLNVKTSKPAAIVAPVRIQVEEPLPFPGPSTTPVSLSVETQACIREAALDVYKTLHGAIGKAITEMEKEVTELRAAAKQSKEGAAITRD